MTNEKMERQLATALEKTAPDDMSGVLSRCETRKGTVINMPTMKTAKRKWTILVAACLAVVLLAGGGVLYQQANAVASVVSLDVNPSIELKVNSSEKVLVCTPLNEDAKAILADMSNGADLKGAKLDVAVNAIVGSLVRNGYLDSISSAIMISVEDKDAARAEKLQRELTSTVDGVLQTSEAKAAVLTQTLTQDAAREQQARENSISTGKAALVNRVLAINPALKFDALAKLSVEELKDLAEAGAPASARSFSSSTESFASASNLSAGLMARTRFTSAALPVEMLFSRACCSRAASCVSVCVRTAAFASLVCNTPSTVLVSSRWSFSARAASLSSTEIMMAEEMLSR